MASCRCCFVGKGFDREEIALAVEISEMLVVGCRALVGKIAKESVVLESIFRYMKGMVTNKSQ